VSPGHICAALTLVLLAGCSSEEQCDTTADNQPNAFTMLTYNVAGLPQGLSGSDPEVNIPIISPLLNQYDVVLVQEDFVYHAELSKDACHPYQTTPASSFGDGLNRFSDLPIWDFEREEWEVCHGLTDSGSDCAAPKGFSVAYHELPTTEQFRIYNLHMDAGNGTEDQAARSAQVDQLLESLTRDVNPVIVAGDTNLKETDEEILQRLLDQAGLTDTCRVLSCGEEDRIDRIMFRSSSWIELVPSNWRVDRSFVREDGEDLSDHEAVAVDFTWSVL
jgi:endonuclease/exonuclease/phosphatase family metal-dependent hydrolase